MKRIVFLAVAALMVCACQKSQKSQVTIVSEGQKKTTVSEICRLPVYNLCDTARMGGNRYVYTIHREPCDSLPPVGEETGTRYADNIYRLRITRGEGQKAFEQTFTKAQFAHLLTKEFRSQGILDGFRFVGAQDGVFSFAVCVSLPDSDMSAPFLLTVSRDGSFAISKDDVMDVYEDGDDEP